MNKSDQIDFQKMKFYCKIINKAGEIPLICLKPDYFEDFEGRFARGRKILIFRSKRRWMFCVCDDIGQSELHNPCRQMSSRELLEVRDFVRSGFEVNSMTVCRHGYLSGDCKDRNTAVYTLAIAAMISVNCEFPSEHNFTFIQLRNYLLAILLEHGQEVNKKCCIESDKVETNPIQNLKNNFKIPQTKVDALCDEISEIFTNYMIVAQELINKPQCEEENELKLRLLKQDYDNIVAKLSGLTEDTPAEESVEEMCTKYYMSRSDKLAAKIKYMDFKRRKLLEDTVTNHDPDFKRAVFQLNSYLQRQIDDLVHRLDYLTANDREKRRRRSLRYRRARKEGYCRPFCRLVRQKWRTSVPPGLQGVRYVARKVSYCVCVAPFIFTYNQIKRCWHGVTIVEKLFCVLILLPVTMLYIALAITL